MRESIAAKGAGEKALIRVESRSRPGLFHFVSLEGDGACSCEGFGFTSHCRHLESLRCYRCLGYGTLIRCQRLVECPSCSGSGRAS